MDRLKLLVKERIKDCERTIDSRLSYIKSYTKNIEEYRKHIDDYNKEAVELKEEIIKLTAFLKESE
jgi:uncharacterized coiled-coil DUF342 family protein